MVGRAASALATLSGSPPSGFYALIGPSIGPCCFETGPEVPAAFAAGGRDPEAIAAPRPANSRARPRPDRSWLDLPLDARLRLVAAGLREANISDAGRCTRCGPEFHSFRRDGPGAGRNWSS